MMKITLNQMTVLMKIIHDFLWVIIEKIKLFSLLIVNICFVCKLIVEKIYLFEILNVFIIVIRKERICTYFDKTFWYNMFGSHKNNNKLFQYVLTC